MFAVVSASAATLGGISGNSVGAEQGTVGDPWEKGVVVSWDTTYATTGYEVTGVQLSTDPEETFPAGAEVKLTIADADGNTLRELSATGVVEGDTADFGAIDGIDVRSIEGVAVVVNGNAITDANVAP